MYFETPLEFWALYSMILCMSLVLVPSSKSACFWAADQSCLPSSGHLTETDGYTQPESLYLYRTNPQALILLHTLTQGSIQQRCTGSAVLLSRAWMTDPLCTHRSTLFQLLLARSSRHSA